MLRDRIVCGIADCRLQRRLLVEPDLTLKKTIKLAQAQKTEDQGAQQLQQKQPQSEQLINLTKSPAPQHGQTTCHRCKGTNHLANECRFKDAICRKCRKKGHIARACHSTAQPPRQQPNASKQPGQQPNPRRTNQITLDTDNTSDTSDSYQMFNVSGTQGRPSTTVSGHGNRHRGFSLYHE